MWLGAVPAGAAGPLCSGCCVLAAGGVQRAGPVPGETEEVSPQCRGPGKELSSTWDKIIARRHSEQDQNR